VKWQLSQRCPGNTVLWSNSIAAATENPASVWQTSQEVPNVGM